jgi:hypothetical protein
VSCCESLAYTFHTTQGAARHICAT